MSKKKAKPEPKTPEPDVMLAAVLKSIPADVADLLNEHAAEWLATVNDSESRAGNITFMVRLDRSEAEAVLTTSSTFSEVHKDKRVRNFEDQRQVPLPGILSATKEFKTSMERTLGPDSSVTISVPGSNIKPLTIRGKVALADKPEGGF